MTHPTPSPADLAPSNPWLRKAVGSECAPVGEAGAPPPDALSLSRHITSAPRRLAADAHIDELRRAFRGRA